MSSKCKEKGVVIMIFKKWGIPHKNKVSNPAERHHPTVSF